MTFGPQAVAYIREELADPDPLADALRQLPLETGRVTAYVPSQVSDEKLSNLRAVFRSSGQEGWQAYMATLEFIHGFLQGGGTRALIMGRHPILPQGWRGLKRDRLGREWAEWLKCEGRVYVFATEASIFDRVHHVFEDGQAMTTFGVLASDLPRKLPRHGDVARAELEDVVRHGDHVLVGAYDSAGMLIWSKPE